MSSSALILVTGASRGLGRAIATVICESVANVRAILVARSVEGLRGTEEAMKAVHKERQSENGGKLDVSSHVMDLSNLDDYDNNLDLLIQDLERNAFADPYDNLVIVNNAGSIGYLGKSFNSPSLQDMRNNVDLNITSALWLTVRFTRHICGAQQRVSRANTIVNISSLASMESFPTMGIYSAGKAARDKYHSVLAKELSEDSNLKVLNYAPGPLETAMVEEIRSAEALDDNLKPNFDQKLLDPNDSARKLLRLVISGNYESGSHIDYYDLPNDN